MAIYGTGHFRSLQGILKIVEIVLCFIGFMCAVVDSWSDRLIDAYLAGTIIAIIIALIIFILHVTSVAQSIEGILAFQLFYNCAWFIYMLIVSAVLLSKHWPDRYMAAGAFGIIVSFVYIVDAYDCYKNNPQVLICAKT